MALMKRWLARVPLTGWAFVFVLAVYWLRYSQVESVQAHGDAHYSWVFARSLAFDGDLDLRNDYALCGDPWHVGVDEGGGRPANPFYLGPALLWAPLLALMRVINPLTAAQEALRTGCSGPWLRDTLFLAPVLGALTLLLAGRAAARLAGEGAAAAAMLTLGFGSTLLHFATLVPGYSHVWAAFGVAVGLAGWLRAHARDGARDWFVAGLCVGFAALMRAQGGLLMLSLAGSLVASLWHARGDRGRALGVLLRGGLAVLGFALVFSVQLLAYKKLYGHWWVVPQGRAYLQLAHAHPWLLMFGARGGLFSWNPLMWLPVFGAAMLLRDRSWRLRAAALLVPLALDYVINSAPMDWHGNASFGARRLTVMAAPAVLFAAVFFARAWAWLSASPGRLAAALAAASLGPFFVVNWGASRGNLDGRVSYNAPVPMPELVGVGARLGVDAVYSRIGNPFVWPATAAFALRYGLGPAAFDRLATGGYFEHDYRPVRLRGVDTINFADASQDAVVAEGFRRDAEGLVLSAGQRGRVLVPVAWWSVTAVTLRGERTDGSSAAAPVRFRVGHFFGRREAATVMLTGRDEAHETAVNLGAFDSGINELVFECPASVRLRSLRLIDRAAHDTRLYGGGAP